MKPWIRFLIGIVVAYCGAAVAQAQPELSTTGVSVSPSSAAPGDAITVTVSVGNSKTTDFTGTASFTVVFTNLVTGSTFTVASAGQVGPTGGIVSKATTDPTSGQTTPGQGTFTFTATVPTQTTQAGGYKATATMTGITGTGGAVGATIGTASYSVSTAVLTITGKPDFQITGLTYAASTSYKGGDPVTMTLTYRNNSSTGGTNNVPFTPNVNGQPAYIRIQVVLSSNPTFGDSDDFQLTIHDVASTINADNSTQTLTWTQLLPGNFAGSYYVLAKIDSLETLAENDPPALTVDGNNIWGVPALQPQATRINILPSNFPANFLVSHGNAATTSSNNYSDNPSISADGRYVVFASDSSNLVSSDTNAARDVFLYDSQTTLVRRLSVSQQGTASNGASNDPKISGDGRYVVFSSEANNLVFGDTNAFTDIFVVDVITGLLTRVSVATGGAQANNPSFRPAISSTGRFIVFESTATNLDSAYTVAPGSSHIYVCDRDVSGSGTFDTAGNTSTRLVDVDAAAPTTTVANAASIQAAISADGSLIAFASRGSNLVAPATTAGRQHVYVRPRANVGTSTSGVKLISVVNGTGAEGNADSQTPSLTTTGNWIAFASLASNLVTGDTNGVSDIFVYDNTAPVAAPIVRRVSVSSAGAQGTDPSGAGFQLGSINPTISSDGRYVAFASLCSNLTSGDISGQSQAADSNSALDIFVRDRDVSGSGTFDSGGNVATQMVSVSTFGYQTSRLLGIPSTAASNIYPVISANGRFVAFPSDAENTAGLAFGATNLLPLDSNGFRDVFLFDRRTNATVTPSTPPTVTITSPGSGNTLLVNSAIPITASATAATFNGTPIGVVSSVQFYVNGTSVGTSTVFPYSATWTPTAVGNYTLSAIVTDSFGNTGSSSNVSVTVAAAPSIGITAPVGGSFITVGTATTVTATAAASNPGATIASVQFKANGVSLGAPITAAPYAITWTPALAGTFNLTAVAIDSIGTQSTSAPVSVTVVPSGGGGGTGATPPTVVLNPPSSSGVVGINVPKTLTATATAPTGATITSVEFLVNGVSIGVVTTPPYTVTWTPTGPGPYSLVALAIDSNGSQATSTPITVTTLGAAPTVSFSPTPPASAAVNIPVTLTASAAADSGLQVTGVQYFVGTGTTRTSIGSATTYPFLVSWTPTTPGTYTISAVASDNAGNQSTAATAAVTVGTGTPPSIPLTSPISGASYAVGNPITVSASTALGSGLVTGVQFFANGISIGSSTSLPFSTTFTPSAAGTYTFTAVVTDSSGNRTTSAPSIVTVVANTAPTVAVSDPVTNSVFPVNVAQTITVTAGSSSGSITSVDLVANGVVIGSKTSFPYTFAWTPASEGAYVFTAVATDNAGVKTTSAPVTYRVTAGGVPTVSITSPPNGSSFPVGNTVNLVADASSPNSGTTIANVQFFANGASIGTKNSFPYTIAWTPTATGTYTVTALATDSSGATKMSAPITITIGQNAAPVIALTSPAAGSTFGLGTGVLLAASASDSDGTVATVQFFANGNLVGSANTPPYTFSWRPSAPGTYQITATATDNSGNITTTPQLPVTINAGTSAVVTLTNPTPGTTYVAGTPIPIVATTTGGNGPVVSVQFFVNGQSVGSKTTAPYTTVWTPAAPGTYTIVAVATDSAGISANSAPLTTTIRGGAAPTATITTPANGTTVTAGTAVNLGANAAAPDGTVASVRFLANGNVVGTASAAPFSVTWTPTAQGTYSVVAQVTDSLGNVANSGPITITVAGNQIPTVNMTAPTSGSSVRVGAGVTLGATAADADGTITSVQFFANGTAVGSAVTTPPYRAQWTPLAEGIYRLTAVATDNAGASATSSAVTVLAVGAGATDVVYAGNYLGADETGRFALINVRGKTGALIAYSTSPTGRTYFFPALTLDVSGGFTASDSSGRVMASGSVNDTGVVGSLDNGRVTLIGPALFPGAASVAAGYYNGNLTGRPASTFAAIVGPDGSIAIFAMDGTFRDAGTGNVTSTGSFTVVTPLGNRFTGIVDPLTGFLTGSVSGTLTSSIMAASASGASFSDGFLRNLSTRGQVGTGSNLLIAGFVVAGSAPKQVLIRAIGPSLSSFGVQGALVDTQLEIYSGSTRVASNDNWGGDPAVQSASGLVGAFPLSPSTFDSALVLRLDPGSYTAQVSGVAGRTGIALIELYDVDNLQPFSPQKVTNVATRGSVGTGQGQLIAGFVVSGNTSKKVLVRAVGPGLSGAPFNVAGALADPVLRLVRGDSQIVRENDNWEQGNDVALINDAASRVGAFPLAAGSRDAAILINLPPGTYSAQVSGTGTTTGVALVEVYEVP